jgi:transposase
MRQDATLRSYRCLSAHHGVDQSLAVSKGLMNVGKAGDCAGNKPDWAQDRRKWFERKYNKPARTALWKLIEQARESALAPLQSVAGALSRWFEPIARDMRHRYTNGMTEGCNNKIKLIQRRAFGLRNEHNRKRRI